MVTIHGDKADDDADGDHDGDDAVPSKEKRPLLLYYM